MVVFLQKPQAIVEQSRVFAKLVCTSMASSESCIGSHFVY